MSVGISAITLLARLPEIRRQKDNSLFERVQSERFVFLHDFPPAFQVGLSGVSSKDNFRQTFET